MQPSYSVKTNNGPPMCCPHCFATKAYSWLVLDGNHISMHMICGDCGETFVCDTESQYRMALMSRMMKG